MSAVPSRPPSSARGGSTAPSGSRQWTRGGGSSAAGGSARNQSVVFNASGTPVPPSSSSASSSSNGRGRGAPRGRGIRGRGRGRGGGGGGSNALALAGALADDDDGAPSADADDGDEELELNDDGPAAAEDEPYEGAKADKADARLQRFTSKFEGNRFEELRKLRGKERADAMRSGAIDDPSVPRQLAARAAAFVGTCEGMCPAFEIEEREAQFNVDRWELLEGTTNRIDHEKAVKMYHRPAAGNEQPLPSDVRTPAALRRSLDYLFTLFPAAGPPAALRPSHGFIRDRTRAIRQDFTIQSARDAVAVECHERMARYHIHCLHALGEEEGFSVQQEMEQLRKILTSLIQFYTDTRNATPSTSTSLDPPSTASAHEAEFSAYLLLTHLFDSDILRQTEGLPPYLFHAPEVQLALELAYLAQRAHDPQAKAKPTSDLSQNFFSRFFKVVGRSSTPYLVAAVVEGHFGEVRKAALGGMRKAFLGNHKAVPADDLVRMLGADDPADLGRLLGDFGVGVGEDGVKLSKETVITDHRQAFHLRTSRRLVGQKIAGWTNLDIINGRASTSGPAPAPRSPSIRSQRSATVTPSPQDADFPFIGVPGEPASGAAGAKRTLDDGGASGARRSPPRTARVASRQPSAGATTPNEFSFPTPTVSAFPTPAPSPRPEPTPAPPTSAFASPSAFAPSPTPPPVPSSTVFSAPSPPPLSSSSSAPAPAPTASPSSNPFALNTAQFAPPSVSQKGKAREPPRRFQEVIVASPLSSTPASAAPTPPPPPPTLPAVPPPAPSSVLEPLPPARAPRKTPKPAAPPLTLNARLARSLADQLVALAMAPSITSICSRALSQEVIDRLEAEDRARERARKTAVAERERARAVELEETARRRREQGELAYDVYERALKRKTLGAMLDAVLRGEERSERERAFRHKAADMGLGRSVAKLERPTTPSQGRDGGGPAILRPTSSYHDVDNRMAELAKSRAAFWEHSTFLHTLLDRLSALVSHSPALTTGPAPPPLQFDVVLSTVPLWQASKAGSWLAAKLGVKPGRHASDGVRGQGVLLTVGDKGAMAGSHDVSLVVFECSPPSAPTGDADDVQRLEDVLAAIPEENVFSPLLLVVGWTPELPPLLNALLGPGTPDHHLLVLDTAEADDAFAAAVQAFVELPTKIERPKVAVSTYLEALRPTWNALLDLGLDTVDRVSLASPSVPGVIDKLLAAVNEQSSRVAAVVSSSQREADELYLPHFAPSEAITDSTSLAKALLEYLDLSRFTDDFAFGPLRADVRAAFYNRTAPPLRAFFEAVFAATSSRLAALPPVPERAFGDARGVDETADGFAEWVADVEAELVRASNAERAALRPIINHVDMSPSSTPSRPKGSAADVRSPRSPVNHLGSVRGAIKRPREDSDEGDVLAVRSPGSVDGAGGAKVAAAAAAGDDAGGAGKFAKLRRIMAAARGII